jgi:hypothetical protein
MAASYSRQLGALVKWGKKLLDSLHFCFLLGAQEPAGGLQSSTHFQNGGHHIGREGQRGQGGGAERETGSGEEGDPRGEPYGSDSEARAQESRQQQQPVDRTARSASLSLSNRKMQRFFTRRRDISGQKKVHRLQKQHRETV